MSEHEKIWALDITWDEGVDLPTLVGPFSTIEEADQWARTNVPNGTCIIRPLGYPYRRPQVTL